MHKISIKIIIAIVVCSAIIGILVGGISIFKSSNLLTKEAFDKLELTAEHITGKISQDIIRYETVVDNFSSVASKQFNTDYSYGSIRGQFGMEGISNFQKNLVDEKNLKKIATRVDYTIKRGCQNTAGAVGGYFIINPELTNSLYQIRYIDYEMDGSFEKVENNNLDFNKGNSNLEWYYNAIEKKEGRWSLPHFDKEAKRQIVSFTQPIYIEGKLAGVVGIEVDFNKYSQALKKANPYKKGYTYLVNKDYNFMVHPDYNSTDNLADVKNGFYKSVVEEMKAKDSGIVDYNNNGKNQILAFSELVNGHTMAIVIPRTVVLGEMLDLRNFLMILIIVGVALAGVIGYFIARSISRPLIALKDAFMQLTKGNLTTKVEAKTRDEVGQVSKSFNLMVDKFRDIIAEITSTADAVNENSELLARASHDSGSASQEVAASIEEVANRANEQSMTMEEAAVSTQSMVNEIKELGQRGSEVVQQSEATSKSARQGKEAIQKITNQMKHIQTTIGDTSQALSGLVEKSNQIGEIVEMINSIANQTQLLALNAAIEAARAGEAGKGFEVVAEEIKALAEETVKSAEQISNLIEGTQQETKKANRAMDNGIEEVRAGSQVMEETTGIFDDIVSAADKTRQSTELTNQNVDNIIRFSDQIREKLEEVSAIAQQTSASAEEVSASTEEQTATIEEITTSAERLNQMSDELETLIKEFTI